MEVEDTAITVEAKVLRFGKNQKDGLTMVLSCHNNENFAAVMAIPLGQPMYVSFVLTGEDGRPAIPHEQMLGKAAAGRAHMLARNPLYLEWAGLSDADAGLEDIHDYCKVASCSEFKDNVMARFQFERLEKSFKGWAARNSMGEG